MTLTTFIKRTPQEKARNIVDAVLAYLNAIPEFHAEYEDVGQAVRANIEKNIEHMTVAILIDVMYPEKDIAIAKSLLHDLTHRPGIEQGFFDPMESEDRGQLVQDIRGVVRENL